MSNMKFKAYMLDVINNIITPAKISIEGDTFGKITFLDDKDFKVDIEGIVLPGFIDSHIHIESTMLTPAQFAKIAVMHGTTAVVNDPHEIANVCGFEGIDFMVENAASVPFDFYFTAPSCVPATIFETSGAEFDSEDINTLLKRDEFVALGEMMNFVGVINNDEEVLNKIDVAIDLNKPIDGHAPLLSGQPLDKYLSRNISTDHECSNFDEAIEKKNKGMKIMVRDSSSAKNLESLFDFSKRVEYWKNKNSFGMMPTDSLERNLSLPLFDFIVSDDKHIGDLIKGHLNKSLKKAIDLEINPIEAIKMVTINPANHYNINAGAIAEGRLANFTVVDNLENLNIKKTYIHGKEVFDGKNVLFDVKSSELKNTFDVGEVFDFNFDIVHDEPTASVNVIKCFNGELLTDKIEATLQTKDNILLPDLEEDILKIAVVERYGGNTIANGFINGFNLKKGAVATSVSHDSHNIIVVGTNSKDMARAVNMIVNSQGGIAIVNKDYENILELPIAGLMSNEDGKIVAGKINELENKLKEWGCRLDSPFTTLSFMALLVIPNIKISNKGLFDCEEFEFLDLIK